MPIEFRASHGEYHVVTRSDAYYFDVYRGEELVGCIARPRLDGIGGRHWLAFNLHGEQLGRGIGPRTALMNFTR